MVNITDIMKSQQLFEIAGLAEEGHESPLDREIRFQLARAEILRGDDRDDALSVAAWAQQMRHHLRFEPHDYNENGFCVDCGWDGNA